MGKGTLIVIEGLDGSGKATQANLLCEALRSEGKKVMQVSFPDYRSDSSALVKMYLAGQLGEKPGDVNAYATSSFYAVDRYASYKTTWGKYYEDGYIIVADRYTTSNAIHQCSKLRRKEWKEYLKWLYDYEFELLGLPSPDCVIYLDVPIETSQMLMAKRYDGDESKKDIHEKDIGYLNASRAAAAFCSDFLHWHRINCADNMFEMRAIEDIASEVLRTAHAAILWSEGNEAWNENPTVTEPSGLRGGMPVYHADSDNDWIKKGCVCGIQDIRGCNTKRVLVQFGDQTETFESFDLGRCLFETVFEAAKYLYYSGCNWERVLYQAQKALESV